ncbi:hypothetical protein [uncultured Microbulbifer sp.]|uniref:hypothetical protein n=1 Tax=uncultured Microbulbifer sp. TaxID=348147 RepID=UPI002636BAAB|nr:hypothetical protein [uncultured Microbulbifer sp.]
MQVVDFLLEFIKDNYEVIIATSALAMTLWQFRVQRWHNRVSVMPYLIRAESTDFDDGNASLKVEIKNNGLGPAFIDEFKVFYKGEEMEAEEALEKALGSYIQNCQYGTMGSKSALAQNESKVILHVRFKAKSKDEIVPVKDLLSDLDLRIVYSSAYKATNELSTLANG